MSSVSMSCVCCDGSRRSTRLEALRALTLSLLGASLLACGGEGDTAGVGSVSEGDTEPSSETCPWRRRALLAQVEVSGVGMRNCGIVQPGQGSAVDCFTGALERGEPAEVTINTCIDCVIQSTFVTLPDEGEFRLYREADGYGDELREVRVESCVDIVPDAELDLSCSGASTLYECSDALPPPDAPL